MLGYDREGGLNSMIIVNVHQCCAEVTPLHCLHIVGHYGTTVCTIRPKPNKRDSFKPLRSERRKDYLLKQEIDASINGPSGELQSIPIRESCLLKLFSDRHRDQRTYEVVCFTKH